jgi:AraC-like DNA-binding protein
MTGEFNLNNTLLQIEKVDIFEVEREKNYRHSYMQGRPCDAFIFVESGSLRYSFSHPANNIIQANTENFLFIPKGAKYYATYLEDNTRIKLIHFSIGSGELPSYLNEPKKIALPNSASIVKSFFKRVVSLPYQSFHYLSLLYDLLWQIELVNRRLPKKYHRLSAALECMSLHPESNNKISYYSDMCYMCEVYFRKLFTEYTGKSPTEYRNELRLEKARTMLKSGEYNVSESATASGFSNLSLFTKLYKKKYGITPKKET